MSSQLGVRVAARLGLCGRYAEQGFTLADLPAVLISAAPDRLELRFEVSAGGLPALELACDFTRGAEGSERDSVARARRLREYLVRADIAGHLDYQSHAPRPVDAPVANGLGLGLALPDDLSLPSGQWLALPLPLLALASDALRHAQAAGHTMAYRLELRPRPSDPARARLFVPAVAALARREGQPALESALRETMALLLDGGWSAAECIEAGRATDVLAWLAPLAARRLRAAWPFLPDGLLSLQPQAAAAEGAEPSPAGQVQSARGAGYLDEVLSRLLPSQPAAPFVQPPARDGGASGSYVFLSYAHADRAFAQQVIERLAGAGLKIWYDPGIEPGAAWDDALEQRLRNCHAVVACVSSNFERSRWCTRELKFADFLGKAIVPVAAGPWAWGSGLQLMFQSLQVCNFDHGHGAAALLEALRAGAPAAFAA